MQGPLYPSRRPSHLTHRPPPACLLDFLKSVYDWPDVAVTPILLEVLNMLSFFSFAVWYLVLDRAFGNE